MQPSKAMYVGDDDGHIACLLASGSDAQRVPTSASGCPLVTVGPLRTRPGQSGLLFWTPDTGVTTHMESRHTSVPFQYPYDVSTYSKDFASWGFATQGTIGEFFALVIKATSVEQKTTFDKGEPYLEVHGVDMDRSIWYSGEYTGAFVIRVTKVVEVAERKAAWAASDVNATRRESFPVTSASGKWP